MTKLSDTTAPASRSREWVQPLIEKLGTIAIGAQVRFRPTKSRVWWNVRTRDERYIIATRQEPFTPAGNLQYTVVDITGWLDKYYNGVGFCPVRSSLNTLGGGYNVRLDAQCREMLDELVDGTWDLSQRRVASIWDVEIKGAAL